MNFKGKDDKGNGFELNLTPLIDIVFLLLIFLMLSATTMKYTSSIKVNLPKATSDKAATKDNIIITVDNKDRIYVDGKPIERESLPLILENLWKKNKTANLVIEADKDATHGTVVYVMDQSRKSGFEKFTISVLEE
ncbi:MAG: biopolymer transporter ExbD [Deferribacterota bacterium]|nr:biopolymer transporter ExbD [Deferribacterota bacterium]